MKLKDYIADETLKEDIITREGLSEEERENLRSEMKKIKESSLEVLKYDKLRRETESRSNPS